MTAPSFLKNAWTEAFDPETLEITGSGETIARAKAQHRTPIAKAKVLLSDFLERVDGLNGDPRGVHYVNQVWLFGSLMRDEETVGDIDLAIETARARISWWITKVASGGWRRCRAADCRTRR